LDRNPSRTGDRNGRHGRRRRHERAQPQPALLAATGFSPRQYLRRVRIEAAKRPLEAPNAVVERIAEQVGYRDPRAFIRAFGVAAGISPGQYRQKFKKA
jgi:transcriptional regulator GlxA family with amidase domain